MMTLAGARVFVAGALDTMTREDAALLTGRGGGRWVEQLDDTVTLVVLGRIAQHDAPLLARLDAWPPSTRPEVIGEDEWCRRVGRIGPSQLRQQCYPLRMVRSLYPGIRPDHLRYLERCGLLRDVVRTPDETWYGFSAIGVLKQVHAALEAGGTLRGVIRDLAAERAGQLTLDFQAPRSEAQPARILSLAPRSGREASETLFPPARAAERSPAERKFLEASALDVGEAADPVAAMAAYRQALELDPDLVPAMINLANLHYLQDHLPEAWALYLHASIVEPSCFEAWFNLGNVHHDGGRLEEAAQCYVEALRLRHDYADAHFYLAVTLEKLGRGDQARPHWRAYQDLAPDGEWIELAREFSR